MALIEFIFNPKVFLVLAIICILFAGAILGAHAMAQHGPDAQKVQKCASDPNRLIAIWTEKDNCTTHNLVQLDGKRPVGDQVLITGNDGAIYEKTSFIPRCGILCQIEKWLRNKGATQTWTK